MTRKESLARRESWVSAATHYKGFDQFNSVTFHLGAEPLVAALKDSPFELDYMPGHEVPEKFPASLDALGVYDAVLLSDIGSNSILLHPDVWLRSRTFPNRLKLLRDWVGKGGALAMIGGYLSYQGIDGRARWRGTAVEDVLPVSCLPYDDRVEMPEGATAVLDQPDHPIVSGMTGPWPPVLGVNEVRAQGGPQCQLDCFASRRSRRPPASRGRRIWSGPRSGLDLRYRPTLAVIGVLQLGWLPAPMDSDAEVDGA